MMTKGPYIGISGWRYPPWRKVFYPEGLPQRLELQYAAERMRSIEINGSFYSLQRPDSYRLWRNETPAGFVFSVKGPRFITHLRRLRDVEAPLANFFASGVLAQEEKLGPFLWQFPPNFAYDHDRFNAFFRLLPQTTTDAATLARGYNEKLKYPPWFEVSARRMLRHAVEIRHPSFLVPQFFTLLRKHKIAFVFADTAGLWPYSEDITANFCYLRLHGAEQLYASGYTDEALEWWASRIRCWAAGKEPSDARHTLNKPAPKATHRDVYVYFDNDAKVHAPFDAVALLQRLNASKDKSTVPRPVQA